jgi:hypothetical protein
MDTTGEAEIKESRFHMLEAARWLSGAINMAPEGTDVTELCHAHEAMIQWADHIDPPIEDWPTNVIRFPIERVGNG